MLSNNFVIDKPVLKPSERWYKLGELVCDVTNTGGTVDSFNIKLSDVLSSHAIRCRKEYCEYIGPQYNSGLDTVYISIGSYPITYWKNQMQLQYNQYLMGMYQDHTRIYYFYNSGTEPRVSEFINYTPFEEDNTDVSVHMDINVYGGMTLDFRIRAKFIIECI